MARPRAETPTYSLAVRGGRYYVQWWENGATQRVSCRTDSLAEARRFLASFKATLAAPPRPEFPTVGEVLEAYRLDKQGKVASQTIVYACRQLAGVLGDLPVNLLNKERVRFYMRERRKMGRGGASAKHRKAPALLSNGTLIRELVTLRAALRWAVEDKMIPEAPHIEVPSAPPPRDRWLTREEADRLLRHCEQPHIRLFVALALYTAARHGALTELRWDQVQLGAGLIALGRGVGNKRRAVVPIARTLRPLLEEAWAEREAARKAGHHVPEFVLEWRGERIGSLKKAFQSAARKADLTGVTPHVLRHTAATWMAQAGRSFEEIAAFLGNSVAMVEKIYAHHHPDHLRAAAHALDGHRD
ncbi:tyrosine-type recombinase/integrase [Roseomonas mucosa]|uniref:tyrosine-type recombinase/integrase n=1 Tax=Roseomonas mucosa TaxID=207340 RepID=UPI00384B6AEE